MWVNSVKDSNYVWQWCILVSLLAAFSISSYSQSVTYVRDDFERDSTSLLGTLWDNSSVFGNSTIEISTDSWYSGEKSLKISMDNSLGAELSKDFTASPPSELTFSFRYLTDGTVLYGSSPLHFLRLRDENGNVCARFYHHPNTDWFQFDYIDGNGDWQLGAGTLERAISADKWHTFRITFKTGQNAEISWSMDGRPIASVNTTTQATGIGYVNFGHTGTDQALTGDVFFDDIRFSSTASDIDVLSRGLVSFTYDDGNISNWTILKPLLDEYGIRASFYAVTDYQEWPKDHAMSAANLLTLSLQGHDIQSHTAGHEDLPTLNDVDLAYQLEHSKAYLESLGLDIDILTLPYGRYNDRVLEAAINAGYSAVFTTDFGWNGKSNLEAPWRILRLDAAMFTTEEIKNWMDLAASENLWVIFYYHEVAEDQQIASLSTDFPSNNRYTDPESPLFDYPVFNTPGKGFRNDPSIETTGKIITNDDDDDEDDDEGDDEYPYAVSVSHMREVFEYALAQGYDVVTADRVLTYPAVNNTPTGISATPNGTSGDKETFTFTYKEPDGHSDFKELYVLMNNDHVYRNGVYLKYDIDQNLLYLADDDNSTWGTGQTPGSTTSLSNSQVTIDVSIASFSRNTDNGQEVSLVVPMDFRTAFAGEKNIYLGVVDAHGAVGFNEFGSFTVVAGTGSVQVTIAPQGAIDDGGLWENDVDSSQRISEAILSGLTAESDITVSGIDLANWLTPSPETVSIVKDQTTQVSLTYVQKPTLSVSIAPVGAAARDITWSVDDGQSWHTSGSSVYVDAGQHTVTLGDDSLYSFSSWSGDNTSSTYPLTLDISADTVLTANYTRNTGLLVVSIEQGGSTGSYSISGPSDFNGGSVLTGQTDTYSNNVPTGSYIITPAKQAEYGLSIAGTNGFTSGRENSQGVVSKDGNYAIDIAYNYHSYTLEVTSNAGGTTDKDGIRNVNHGDEITITPAPESGFVFDSWSGDAIGSAAPLDLTITSDLDITANFHSIVENISVEGQKHRGMSGLFTATWRDGDGHDDLTELEFLMNSSPVLTGGLYLKYQAASNTLLLRDETDSQWKASAQPGSQDVISNDFVEIEMSEVIVQQGSTSKEKQLVLPLIFKADFKGTKEIYLNATDGDNSSGWSSSLFSYSVEQLITLNQSPVNDQVWTNTDTGSNITFTGRWKDGNGSNHLAIMELIICDSLSKTSSVYIRYDARANELSLRDDSHSSWITGTLGTNQIIENSQVVIDLNKIEVRKFIRIVELDVPCIFKSAYAGEKKIYMCSYDLVGANDDWEEKGSCTITGNNHGPMNKSVSPASGSGNSQSFDFVWRDLDGSADITTMEGCIAATTYPENTVWFLYDTATGQLSLRNDTNTAWSIGTPGEATILSNSQADIDLSTASITANGEEIQLTLPVSFLSGYSGNHNIWMKVTDSNGLVDDWQDMGDWTATEPSGDSTSARAHLISNSSNKARPEVAGPDNTPSGQKLIFATTTASLPKNKRIIKLEQRLAINETLYISGRINPGLEIQLGYDRKHNIRHLLVLSERTEDNNWEWREYEIEQGQKTLLNTWSQVPMADKISIAIQTGKTSLPEILHDGKYLELYLPTFESLVLTSQVHLLDVVHLRGK